MNKYLIYMTTPASRAFALTLMLVLLLFWSCDNAMAADAPIAQPNYTFYGKDVTTVITEALSSAGAGNNVTVHINGVGMQDDDAVANASAPISAEVENLQVDKAHSHWEATLLLKANDKNIAPLTLAGHYEEMTQIPVLKRQLQAGEVISQADIEWSTQAVTHLHKATITDPKDLIGKSPKRMITQGRPIRLDEIANLALINKGARITLLYKSRALVIKTLGEAMDSGAKGDVIRVKNVTSKQIIEGTVETGDIVRVTSPDSTSAEAL